MPEAKILAIFLPFFGAGLYGLVYALNENIFVNVSISTYVFVSNIVGAALIVLLHLLSPLKIDFSPLMENRTAALFCISVVASILGWIVTCFAIKSISANYASIAEISYPFFTILFGYLIFSRKIDWSVALGAVLIFAGSLILIVGKLNGR
jgi:drug/metabolite transporter (DMT)-like permease